MHNINQLIKFKAGTLFLGDFTDKEQSSIPPLFLSWSANVLATDFPANLK